MQTQVKLLLLVILAAGLLRAFRLDAIPPGISTDDAQEGTDAISVLQGDRPIYFSAGGGREPMMAYLDTLTLPAFGATPLALRVPAAIAGVVSILALFWLAREMFDARVALVAAALVAVSYWDLHESRTGLRAILLPFFECFAFYFFWRAWNWTPAPQPKNKKRDAKKKEPPIIIIWIIAGAALGLTLYTYSAARVLPFIILLFLGAMWFTARDRLLANKRNLILYAASAFIVFAPLGYFFVTNPSAFTDRLSQVTSNELTPLSFLGAIARNILPTLGMFSFVGDPQWKYNIAGRPVFDAITSFFFYAGILIAILRIIFTKSFDVTSKEMQETKEPKKATISRISLLPSISFISFSSSLFLLLWFLIGLLPGMLSDESPHFLRTIAALPPTYIFVALALIAAYNAVRSIPLIHGGWGDRVAQAAILGLLIFTGYQTTRDYFGTFANEKEVYHVFYGDLWSATQLLMENLDERAFISVEYEDLNGTIMRYYSSQLVYPTWRLYNAGNGFVATSQPALYIVPFTAPANDLGQNFYKAASAINTVRAQGNLMLYRAYQIDGIQAAPQFPLAANLNNAIQILGYDASAAPQAGGTLNLALYANALNNTKLDLSYKFFAHLVDANGYEWSSDEALASDASEWQKDETVVTFFHLPIPSDAPPKDYHIEFGFYSPTRGRVPVVDTQGRVLGTTVSTAPLRIARSATPADASKIQSAHRTDNIALNELSFLGYDAGDSKAGEPFRFTFYLRADSQLNRDYPFALSLNDATGKPIATKNFSIAGGAYPTSQWRAGDVVRDSVTLDIPVETSAGDYALTLRIGDQTARVATIRVDASEHRFTIPQIQNRLSATLGDSVEFLGYDIDPSVKPGDTFALTLYWRAKKTMATSYTVFTHLLDAQNRVLGQRDRLPLNGDRPTTSWVANEVLIDRYRIPVPADTKPGSYAMEIGMYDATTVVRLPVVEANGARMPDDRILLGNVQIK